MAKTKVRKGMPSTMLTKAEFAQRLGERFPRGRPVALASAKDGHTFDGIARMGGAVFRVVAVPLEFSDGTTVGTRRRLEEIVGERPRSGDW